MITRLYAALLRLYPRQFQTEFGEEMQSGFEEIIENQSGLQPAFFLLLNELGDLPNNLLKAYAAERPPGWETVMKKRMLYFIGIVVLGMGIWASVTIYLGFLNPLTFFALVFVVVLIAFPLSPIIRRVRYKIWVFVGFIILAGLFLPPPIYKRILPTGDAEPFTSSVALTILSLISVALVITALLINFIFQINNKLRDTNTGKRNGIQEESKKSDKTTMIIFALIVLLMAKAFHSFYWFIIWDSTTDPLDWLWLPIPILAVIFSSFLLYFLLPDRNKSRGFLYLLMIPALIGVYNLAESVDFRQLTNQRAEYVSQLIETYHERFGRYPGNLENMSPRYALSIPGPVIIFGQDWCYDSGEDYYRLGYVTRLHWSDPRLIGRIYKTKGEIPLLPRMCQADIAAIQERYPDYPYEYWQNWKEGDH